MHIVWYSIVEKSRVYYSIVEFALSSSSLLSRGRPALPTMIMFIVIVTIIIIIIIISSSSSSSND